MAARGLCEDVLHTPLEPSLKGIGLGVKRYRIRKVRRAWWGRGRVARATRRSPYGPYGELGTEGLN